MSLFAISSQLTPRPLHIQPLFLATVQAEYRFLHSHGLLRRFKLFLLLSRLFFLLFRQLIFDFLLLRAEWALLLHLNLALRLHPCNIVFLLLDHRFLPRREVLVLGDGRCALSLLSSPLVSLSLESLLKLEMFRTRRFSRLFGSGLAHLLAHVREIGCHVCIILSVRRCRLVARALRTALIHRQGLKHHWVRVDLLELVL